MYTGPPVGVPAFDELPAYERVRHGVSGRFKGREPKLPTL